MVVVGDEGSPSLVHAKPKISRPNHYVPRLKPITPNNRNRGRGFNHRLLRRRQRQQDLSALPLIAQNLPVALQTSQGHMIPVSAVHVAQSIDLLAILSTVFTAKNSSTQHKMFGKNSIVVELPQPPTNGSPGYVAVFRFGSVVGLNVSPRDLSLIVGDIKRHNSTIPVLAAFERKESFSILVDQERIEALDAEEFSKTVTGDYCIVPELDINGVAVISNIMAQTVALDSYNDTVDGLLTKFAEINSTVTKTGSFTSADKDFLFRSVAQNNGIFIDMISRVRIKDRSDTAWNLVKYENIHYGLKKEFEIDDRFEHIEFKLNLIQQNAKFFLEMLHHQKSNMLEWTIVALIVTECGLMCLDMSGLGGPLFSAFRSLFQYGMDGSTP